MRDTCNFKIQQMTMIGLRLKQKIENSLFFLPCFLNLWKQHAHYSICWQLFSQLLAEYDNLLFNYFNLDCPIERYWWHFADYLLSMIENLNFKKNKNDHRSFIREIIYSDRLSNKLPDQLKIFSKIFIRKIFFCSTRRSDQHNNYLQDSKYSPAHIIDKMISNTSNGF